MRTRFLLPLLLLTACERDFSIANERRVTGATNPPSLTTPSRTDTIIQVSPPEVDILWVIDNSGSMSDKQRKLANEFAAFATFFEDTGIDWHMGVITTDMDDPDHSGHLVMAGGKRYLTPEDDDWQDLFRTMARVGDDGSGQEQGRAAVMAALTDPLAHGWNKDFYREDAFLHIVVISDEDDDSDTPTRGEFVDFLRQLKSDEEMVTFNAIVGPRGFFTCITATPALGYLNVVDAVGGLEESICARDWTPMLEQLGLQAAGVKQEFFLSEVPVPGTISVEVHERRNVHVGVDLDSLRRNQTVEGRCEVASCFGFSYDGVRNSVVFDGFVPVFGSEVQITYDLLAQQVGADDE